MSHVQDVKFPYVCIWHLEYCLEFQFGIEHNVTQDMMIIVILISSIIGFFSCCGAYRVITPQSTSSTFNFVMHGDWGWNTFNQTLTSYEMSVYAWAINAQFLIALGDNFYNDGVTSIFDELWDTAFHDVYSTPSLDIPWYSILGNHDYHGNIQAQVARTKVLPFCSSCYFNFLVLLDIWRNYVENACYLLRTKL